MAVGQPAPGGRALRGRRDECALLDQLREGARTGRSGVLVLQGEAGVGKTALLDYAIGSASDMLVVQATGVESESELAFAALHQLCMPLLGRLQRLPAPQRYALEIPFGLSEGPAPDRFFVGLAVLGLLSEAAEERPLLCVIDDAQWLDGASAQALAFVARRLLEDSVMMLFAVRAPVPARWPSQRIFNAFHFKERHVYPDGRAVFRDSPEESLQSRTIVFAIVAGSCPAGGARLPSTTLNHRQETLDQRRVGLL